MCAQTSSVLPINKKTSLPSNFPSMQQKDTEDHGRKTSLPTKKLSAAKASTIIEDSRSYKIILDAFGYNDDQLSITLLNGNAVLIEGHHETHSEGRICKKTLRKPYQIPNDVNISNGFCVLSTEGTLSLVLPKMSVLSNNNEEYKLDPRLRPPGKAIKIHNKINE